MRETGEVYRARSAGLKQRPHKRRLTDFDVLKGTPHDDGGATMLTEIQKKAEEASFQIARGATQIPAKLDAKVGDLEIELNQTIQQTDEVHKTITKGERKVKELLFQQEENKKNQDRITDLVDKLQQKIKSYKKQIEEAEEIAAINLAKYRKAQQDFEEAEERSKICEANITKYKSARGVSMSPGPVSFK